MTSLPDWLVERAALDEVPPAHRERLAHADPRELEARIAALRADTAAELAAHPPGPVLAQIEARVAAARRRATRRAWLAGSLGIAAAAAVAVLVIGRTPAREHGTRPDDEITRVKGAARLLAFRLAEDRVERLEQDALVQAGDLIQLRYNGGGQHYGVIASIDGSGVVTLHHPAAEDAPPAATALAPRTTALPNAYALDAAPRFERFFFVTADEPIDVASSLAALRAFARRSDAATAALDLPAGLHQWSLRLRKPDPEASTP